MTNYHFENKHIFFMADNDTFTNLFLDAIINKLGLKPCDIFVLTFPTGEGLYNSRSQIADVQYALYLEGNLTNISKAKSLTFMSLNNWNAPIIKFIFDLEFKIMDKLYIYITDDELERWNSSYKKFGKLVENTKKHLSKDVLFVLPNLKNFIVPKEYFHNKLLTLLQRDTFRIIDSSVIFDILPYNESEKLYSFTENNFITKNKLQKIMIGTKNNSFSMKDAIKIIKSFTKVNLHSQYEFIYTTSLSKRILIDLYLLFVKTVKKQKITITYCSNMSPLLYNTLLISSTFIILQPRGGASSARLFLKWTCGHLVMQDKSPNSLFFEKVYNTDFIRFDNTREIANKIVTHNIDAIKNKNSITNEELRSIEELKKIYN
jgi:hypothetical protein